MSYGISIHGDNGNLVIDENSAAFEFIGSFTPIEDRLAPKGLEAFAVDDLWVWTHWVDVSSPDGRPLVFLDIPFGPAVGLTGNGAAVIGVKLQPSGLWRVFLVVALGYTAPTIRCFAELKTPSTDQFGMRIHRADNSLVFDSGKKMLWVRHLGDIETKAAYTMSSSSLDEAEPTKNTQVDLTSLGDLSQYAICCYTRPMCFRSNTTAHKATFYHWVYSYDGAVLQGRWTRSYKASFSGSLHTGEGTYSATDREHYVREFALIDKAAFT